MKPEFDPINKTFWFTILSLCFVAFRFSPVAAQECGCNGDATNNGTISEADYERVDSCIGHPINNGCSHSDIDCSGVIDMLDLTYVSSLVDGWDASLVCTGDCQNDGQGNGTPDGIEINQFMAYDCNLNHVPDECEGSFRVTAPLPTGNRGRYGIAKFDSPDNSHVRFSRHKPPPVYLASLASDDQPDAPSTAKLRSVALTAERQLSGTAAQQHGSMAQIEILAKEIYTNEPGASGPVDVRVGWSVSGSAFPDVNTLPNVWGYDFGTGTPGYQALINLGGANQGDVTLRFHAFYYGAWHTFDSTSNNFVVFNDGDNLHAVLAARGFPDNDQDGFADVLNSPIGPDMKIGCFIAQFLDPSTDNLMLPFGWVLFLGELGTTNQGSTAFDLQDIVAVIR